MVKNTKRNSKININNKTIKYGGIMPNVNYNPKGLSLEEISKIFSDAGYNIIDYIDKSTNVIDIDQIPSLIRPILKDFVELQNRNIKIATVSVVAGTIGALLTTGVAPGVAAAAATTAGLILTAGQQSLAISAAKSVYNSIPPEVFDDIGKQVYRDHLDLLHAIGTAVLHYGLDKIPITNNPVIDNALHNRLKPTKLSVLNIGLNIINKAMTGEKKFLNIISDSQSYIINGRTETIITKEYSMSQRELIDEHVSKLQSDVLELYNQLEKVQIAEKTYTNSLIKYNDLKKNNKAINKDMKDILLERLIREQEELKIEKEELNKIEKRISEYEIPLSMRDLLNEFFESVSEGSVLNKQIHMFSGWKDIVTTFLTNNPPPKMNFVENGIGIGVEIQEPYKVMKKKLNYDKVTKTDEAKLQNQLEEEDGNSIIRDLFQLESMETIKQKQQLQQQEEKLAEQYGKEYDRRQLFEENVNMADFVDEVVAKSIADYAEDIEHTVQQLLQSTAIATIDQLDAEIIKRYNDFDEDTFTKNVIEGLNDADREIRPELKGENIEKLSDNVMDEENLRRSEIKNQHLEKKLMNEINEEAHREDSQEVGEDIRKLSNDDRAEENLRRSEIKKENLEKNLLKEMKEEADKEFRQELGEDIRKLSKEEIDEENLRRYKLKKENLEKNLLKEINEEADREIRPELKGENIGKLSKEEIDEELLRRSEIKNKHYEKLQQGFVKGILNNFANKYDGVNSEEIPKLEAIKEEKDKGQNYEKDKGQNYKKYKGQNSFFSNFVKQDTFSLLQFGAVNVLKYRESVLKKCIVKAREETIRQFVKTDKPFKEFNHILHKIYITTIPTTDEARILEYNTAMRQYNGKLTGVIDLIEKLKREIIGINEKMDGDLRNVDKKLKEDIEKYDTTPYEIVCGIMEANLGLKSKILPKEQSNFEKFQSELSNLQTDIVSKLYGKELTESGSWTQLEELQSSGNLNFSEAEQNLLHETINNPYVVSQGLFSPTFFSPTDIKLSEEAELELTRKQEEASSELRRKKEEEAASVLRTKKTELIRLLENIERVQLKIGESNGQLVKKFNILFDKDHPDFNIVYRKINKNILTLDETIRWKNLLSKSEPLTRHMLELLDFNIDDIKTELKSIRLNRAASDLSLAASNDATREELAQIAASALAEEEENMPDLEEENMPDLEDEYAQKRRERELEIREEIARLNRGTLFHFDEERQYEQERRQRERERQERETQKRERQAELERQERERQERERQAELERQERERQERERQAELERSDNQVDQQITSSISENITSHISLPINPNNSMFTELFTISAEEGILTGVRITDDNLLNNIKNEFQNKFGFSRELLNRTHIRRFLENKTNDLTEMRDNPNFNILRDDFNNEITRMADYTNVDRYFYLSVNNEDHTFKFRIAASIGKLRNTSFICNIISKQSLFFIFSDPAEADTEDEKTIDFNTQFRFIVEPVAVANKIRTNKIHNKVNQNYEVQTVATTRHQPNLLRNQNP